MSLYSSQNPKTNMLCNDDDGDDDDDDNNNNNNTMFYRFFILIFVHNDLIFLCGHFYKYFLVINTLYTDVCMKRNATYL